ncbi:hypothetical protein HO663_04685 [Streptococcus suis]|uniref:Uncharacterized protein n=1 Tax=Streptococcus suis TaxID=1307 RepID=A0A0Z8G278_STRSU|nr:hypothetical protein [Streptococcus suis]NQH27389.1 hypothetical protein [Streptococcus suis]NQH47929.1 hypothetical protein [Streptococcus suis]NQP26828.1 hypothetical protein [Streptococcus suis]NQP37861.1 hypothetical protein [Streptococcus suis]NQP44506.1 hypothetical protein [Streptococcus suis]
MNKLGKAILGLALAGGLAFPMASASAQAICSRDDVLHHQNLTDIQRKVLLDEKDVCLASQKAEAASLINKSDLSPRQKAKYLSLVEFGSSKEVLALVDYFFDTFTYNS